MSIFLAFAIGCWVGILFGMLGGCMLAVAWKDEVLRRLENNDFEEEEDSLFEPENVTNFVAAAQRQRLRLVNKQHPL
jgi:hypothetical protein